MVPVHGTVLTLITHEPPLQVWRFSEVCVVRCGHGSDVVGGVPSLLRKPRVASNVFPSQGLKSRF